MKITISPRHDHYPQTPFEVEAHVVSNIFACWKDEHGTIFEASGDDGNWWITSCYNQYWIDEKIHMLTWFIQ